VSETNSRQAAVIAAGNKVLPNQAYGKVRCVVITTPATHALANGDTIASGIALPVGTRVLASSVASTEGMGAGVTIDVGLRNFKTKAAIDANGIAAAVDVAAAGRPALNNGALVGAGVESVTTEVSEPYVTIGGANPTADKQMRIELMVLTID
jgi:hypothetical protein